MRLNKLTISEFKNLRDFTIEFDQRTPTTVLVGRNGTGKSNLLEALAIIFRDLDLGDKPAFKYQLDYVCRGKHIIVDADPQRSRSAIITVDGSTLSQRGRDEVDYLPNFIFGYYSGTGNRLEAHFRRHQKKFYDDVLLDQSTDPSKAPLRRLFYARPDVHADFVLIAFYTERNKKILRFLREHLRIEGLDTILFVIQQPPWKSKTGDPRFWNAGGVVRQLLDRLYALATAPIRTRETINIDFRRRSRLQVLYLFLRNQIVLDRLAAIYRSQQDFFKSLESTYISQLLREARIKVKVRGVDGSLTFRELSEGEQQLLMVLAGLCPVAGIERAG
jgi:energy-coupling factor transporter ATP-binding protein EcfA2